MDFTKVIAEFNEQLDLVTKETKYTKELEKRLASYCTQYNALNSSSYQLFITSDKEYTYDLLLCTDNGKTVFRTFQFELIDFVDYVRSVKESVDPYYPFTSLLSLNDSLIYKHFLDFILIKVK